MTNSQGYRDPTAEKAVAKVMREERPTRFLPKDLLKALRTLRDVFSLIGYEVTDIKIKDRENGKEYVWSTWE